MSKFYKNTNILLIVFFLLLSSGSLFSQVEKYREAEKKYFDGDTSQFDYVLKRYIDSYYSDSEAALTLGRMGNPDAVKYLSEAVFDNDSSAKEAVTALGMIKDKRAVPALIRVVREDREYAVNAVNILSDLKDIRAVPILKLVVEQRKSYYLEAIDALGKIGDPSVTHLVMNILKEKPESEPKKILFKIEHPELEEDKIKARERIINVSEPSSEVLNYMVTYDNFVKIFYKLSDFDSDTLNVLTHYSLNSGRTWSKANIIGKSEYIPRLEYENSLLWKPEQDLGQFTTEEVMFRIVPVDDPLDFTRGFPGVIRIPIDTNYLFIKNLPELTSGEVELLVYNPIPAGGNRRDLSFHYSLDEGNTWGLSTIERGLPKEDTLRFFWQSEVDLPGTDVENVIMRVSSVGSHNLGRTVFSNKFHIDNNTPPSVKINSIEIDENNIVALDYSISDVENDPVSLSVEYSTDKGISWMLATISGELTDLNPGQYHGKVTWYYDFDISDTFTDSVRVKITPFDNNIGFMNESGDFISSQIRSLTIAKGRKPGDLELKYNTIRDIERLEGKYSTDGGRTWQDAKFKAYEDYNQPGMKSVRFNWNVDDDILKFRTKLDFSIRTIRNLRNPEVVPDLIRISLNDTSPVRSEREKSLAIKEIFNEQPKWVVDGMLQALIHDNSFIRNWSYNFLKNIPEPRVIAALDEYDRYWEQRMIYEEQHMAVQKEVAYQEWIDREIRPKPVGEDDMIDFIMKQGFTELQAKKMLKSLELDKETKRLNQLFKENKISEADYLKQRDKVRKELKDIKDAEREEKKKKSGDEEYLNRFKKGFKNK